MLDRTFIGARWRAGLHVLRTRGLGALVQGVGAAWRRHRAAAGSAYPEWVARHATLTPDAMMAMAAEAARFSPAPRFSILMPVFDPPETALRAALDSVLAQVYPHWELCIADDRSSRPSVRALLEDYARRDTRIKVAWRKATGNISVASSSALALAGGEFIALLDHDDTLTPDALYRIARELQSHPDAAMLYSDEDKLDFDGRPAHPNFKPDWNYDLFLSHHLAAHLAVFRAEVVREAGGFRAGFEGAQDYDLALRVVERIEPRRIRHIPRVLYHWRMVAGSTAVVAQNKDAALENARRAVEEHLQRRRVAASVETLAVLGSQRVRYPYPTPAPAVAVIADAEGARARNAAARGARGDFLVFLSPGVELDEDSLRELVSQAAREEVGAAGGRVIAPDGTIVHAGAIARVGYAHRGVRRGDGGYMQRAELVQAMSAVSGDCICVRRADFVAAGGFDESLERAFHDLDFCLRLSSRGSRNVFTPFAEARARAGASLLPPWDAAAMERFAPEAAILRSRWGALLESDPHYNPNLSREEAFALAWPPRSRAP